MTFCEAIKSAPFKNCCNFKGRAAHSGFWCFVVFVLPIASALASETLGKINFPTSGLPKAQVHFEQGVLLLHSFEYDDAAEEFQKAQLVDPHFAMAYWGEAMTHNKPLWRKLDQESGQRVLMRLGEKQETRLAKASTVREKGYLGAVETLFFGDGHEAERDSAYAATMGKLAAQFPDDMEATAFHALAVLGTAQGKRDFKTYMKAASIAQTVFDQNPNHPGAAHYLIHSFDDPIHAPLGLPAAQVYADIAPAAAHALHMPSHIFVALGMWNRTAASNEDSWRAADNRVRRKGLSVKDRSYHALLWLQYAYLQQGRYFEARKLLNVMTQDAEELDIPLTRRHLAAMRAQYVIETRHWATKELFYDLDFASVRAEDIAALLFTQGMAAVKNGTAASAEKQLNKLEERVKILSEKSKESRSVDATRATALQLRGLLDLARGHERVGLKSLQESTRIQETMPLAYGPPSPVKPPHELLGEVLLKLGRYTEASTAFDKALEFAPKRALSLLGAARAAKQGGDFPRAEQFYGMLRNVWNKSDALPERDEFPTP
jgi:tetratricopeptide (TPR) repeat protein